MVSCFLLLHSMAGARRGHVEQGRGRRKQGCRLTDRHLVFRPWEEGTFCFLGSKPAGGGFGNPAHSSHLCLLSLVAACPESCPVITNGALCSRDKEHVPHPPIWAEARLLCPDLGLRRDSATSQEGKLRSRDRSVEPEEGSTSWFGGGGVAEHW